MRRAHAVVAGAVLLVGGVASPSAAQVIDGCIAPGYPAGTPCEVEIEPDCIDTVPTLPYLVVGPDGQPATGEPIDITWVNPGGDDVVLADQPLTGDLVWPGTVVGADGRATDWPDWTQNANGTWSRGDAFTWAVGTVDVQFGGVTVQVEYPDEPECRPEGAVLAQNPVPPARTTPRPSGLSGVLAATGLEAESLAIGAGALVAAGAGLVLLRRSRREV
jgi:LPXTG-motif cell wall-anchored protein